MYNVYVTEQAADDLRKAALYIAVTLGNKAAAKRLIDAAEKAMSSLDDFPERNPLVSDPFLAANGIRIIPVKNYLAFYTVHKDSKTVSVVRFLSARRDWSSVLGENK